MFFHLPSNAPDSQFKSSDFLTQKYLGRYQAMKPLMLQMIHNDPPIVQWNLVKTEELDSHSSSDSSRGEQGLTISKCTLPDTMTTHSNVTVWRGDVEIPNLKTSEFLEEMWSERGLCSTKQGLQTIDPDQEYCELHRVFHPHYPTLVLLHSQYNSGSMLVSNRDVLVYRYIEQISPTEWLAAGSSVDDEDFLQYPCGEGCVRANVIQYGYLFQESYKSDGQCDLKITNVIQTAVGGFVPDFIANRVNKNQVYSLLRYKKYFMDKRGAAEATKKTETVSSSAP